MRAGENVQLALIGSQSRAFQQVAYGVWLMADRRAGV